VLNGIIQDIRLDIATLLMSIKFYTDKIKIFLSFCILIDVKHCHKPFIEMMSMGYRGWGCHAIAADFVLTIEQ